MRSQLHLNRFLVLSSLLFLPAGLLAESPSFDFQASTGVFPVPYEKFGEFKGIGTDHFKYHIKDRLGLRRAMGAGLYPSLPLDLNDDPGFDAWRKKNANGLIAWDFVNTGDPQSDFYAWTLAKGIGPGTKLFFTAKALAEAEQNLLALKAYRGVVIHFYKEPCWSADHSFVWYPAKEALSRIEGILSHHPELGLRLDGAVVKVENGNDTNLHNDRFVVNPGRWVRIEPTSADPNRRIDLSGLSVLAKRGEGRVRLVQFENKHWRLLVDGSPYLVRGITYLPTAVGRTLENEGANAWMTEDRNRNDRPDAPYDAWLDKNRNNAKDGGEKPVGDFEFLQQMGVNTIRLFRSRRDLDYDASEFNVKLLRDLNRRYGIKVIMGDFIGAYTVGSGATWEDGTDYTDPDQRSNMEKLLKSYVLDQKDEPYVLMWLLGNENVIQADYSGVNATRTNASSEIKAYLTFVNKMAAMIHQLDPDHPVAVGNLDLLHLEDYARYAPEVDVFGVNSYRGSAGFGDLWKRVQQTFDRPVLVTEYGVDAYDSRKKSVDEEAQMNYHRRAWEDVLLNSAGRGGVGNSIGGVIFEYLDEWWKSQSDSWRTHSVHNDDPMAFPDGWAQEEWYGVMGQGDGSHSPFLRQPRKVYYLYRDELWKDSYKP